MMLRWSCNRWSYLLCALIGCLIARTSPCSPPDDGESTSAPRPQHIVLVMADDQGWGEVGYRAHPVLKTPNLDAMASAGLRFERFYAGGPVCSPTRATVLTGRTHERSGVKSHGYALRRQEKTLAQALRQAGYRTGHFGKWHLNGMRGPGVPILASDSHHPGVFGFDQWLSVTNFFDRDPILSRMGRFEEFQGDSSEIVTAEALRFIEQCVAEGRPSFTVIWFGSPHSPFRAAQEDTLGFSGLDEASRNHYGEIVALDRAVGTLREGLRRLEIANDTLVWYCSDNGGLPKINPETVGGLRGFKGSLYEGGIRVPAIIEWPGGIRQPRVIEQPACTMDIFPTIVDLLGLPDDVMLQPIDGRSLVDWFNHPVMRRDKPIPFHYAGNSALIDNEYKLLEVGKGKKHFELYNLVEDSTESRNLIAEMPEIARRLQQELKRFQESLQRSVAGKDYPEGRVLPGEPEPRFWTEVEAYRPYFDQWRERPEYASRLKNVGTK